MRTETKSIILGGGCFWCIEAIFQKVKGVKSVKPGYAGGNTENPTYEIVSSEETGHAEVAKIDYDDTIVSLGEILEVFFKIHDPTTLNRQGNDIGQQYRSIMLYETEEERKTMDAMVKSQQKNFKDKIVTEIKKLDKFYPAEKYHENYYTKNMNAPYCKFVILPKILKAEKELKDKMNINGK